MAAHKKVRFVFESEKRARWQRQGPWIVACAGGFAGQDDAEIRDNSREPQMTVSSSATTRSRSTSSGPSSIGGNSELSGMS